MEQPVSSQWIKISAFIFLGIFVILGGLVTLGLVYADRILPSVNVGTLELGDKTETQVRVILAGAIKTLDEQGITVQFDRGQGVESKQINLPDAIDLDVAVAGVTSYGKSGNLVLRGWQVLTSLFGQAKLPLPGIVVSADRITEVIKTNLAEFEHPAQNAALKIISVTPFKSIISSSTPGVVFDYSTVGHEVIAKWQQLKVAQVTVQSSVDQPTITEAEIAALSTSTEQIFVSPITLTHYDAHTKRPYQWSISRQKLADWSEIKKNENGLYLAIKSDAVAEFVSSTVKKVVDVAPADATFELNAAGTRATKFVGARPGVTVDLAATEQGIEQIFAARKQGTVATSTAVVIATVQPSTRTEDTNTLGIKEILGYGTSNFSGSPRNRILNIRNAVVNKLNGTIIKPGEEFSLVNTLKPFTLEAGYLPELVILGNRIKPEVAGGLCQVGTTMFRAAMNSGLAITARTNHGLVVSYYNDPSNGNPGTDATIYEPNPDFRFKNDTGHHVLVSTDMNVATGELTFYLWGTNDGRKAYYTPPKVLSRIPAGPPETIETKDLAPGKKECQGVHPGAVTTFNYVRQLASGDKEVREFKSSYRAVPATCYVGYDPNKPQCTEGDPNCISGSETTPGAPTPLLDTVVTSPVTN